MIKLTQRGIPEIRAFLDTVKWGFKDVAAKAYTEYIIGMDQGSSGMHTHGLMHYPMYKYISMEQAYGGFKTDKQRRYVMAAIRDGRIDPGAPHRTGELQRGWTYTGKDTRYTIKNETSYAEHVMGQNQANMMYKIGWRKALDVARSNMAGAARHARAKVKQWIKEHRKA
jgi:hypothetical protein